ncbi:hypothetical protein DMENIID0001_119120 [Sergentomyia squamirostris]
MPRSKAEDAARKRKQRLIRKELLKSYGNHHGDLVNRCRVASLPAIHGHEENSSRRQNARPGIVSQAEGSLPMDSTIFSGLDLLAEVSLMATSSLPEPISEF